MEQIGRYQILDEIGRGAMGVVYRAQDPAIGRIIAIKTIRLNDLADPEERDRLRDRLFREAQAAGMLSHPNIVTIYDIAEERGQACIFMEYVHGPSLEALMTTHQLPGKETFLTIFRQTAAALDYAHKKGIVHRDIKPANILIHEDGQAKITDFGVAKVISQQMTYSGTIMGTPNYMSPEQVQGFSIDGRADQFGLAVVAYELLTGEKPFVGEYLPTLLYKIVREEPVRAMRLNRTIGPRIDGVLSRGLAKDPAARYATCSEFVGELASACGASPDWTPVARGASYSLPTVGQDSPVGPPRAKHRLAGLAARQPRASKEPTPVSPWLKTLVWVFVGIGVVGLALLGAQKFLFVPPSTDTVAAVEPAPTAANKPSPVAQPPEQLPGDAGTDPPLPKQEEPANPPEEPAAVAPVKNSDQAVQLLTDPPGAKVIVDDALSCKAPCMLTLTNGRHTLSTERDGYRPYPLVFNVPDKTDIFLKLTKLSGTLSVTSNPEGASIRINGEAKGQPTPTTFALSPGTYHVQVTKDGVPVDFDVQIKDGEFQNRNVNFQ